MFRIDRDYTYNPRDGIGGRKVGTEGNESAHTWFEPASPLPVTENTVRFRLLDDDREVYYGGWLHDDDECENQSACLYWGMYDSGCTIIEVKREGQWVQEIA